MKKWFVVALVILVSASLYAGGKQEPGAGGTGMSKWEGQTIVVKLSPDIAMSGLSVATEQFEAEYGVKVDYNEIGWDVWFPQQAQILATDEPLDVMGNGKNAWIEFPDKLTPLTDLFPEIFEKIIKDFKEIFMDYGGGGGE